MGVAGRCQETERAGREKKEVTCCIVAWLGIHAGILAIRADRLGGAGRAIVNERDPALFCDFFFAWDSGSRMLADVGAEPKGLILVTGASGYIGGRLVPRLLEAGYRVRCVVRSARKLDARRWVNEPGVEIAECDLTDVARVEAAMRGCVAAYYLVHSMISAGSAYRAQDRELAAGFARSAATAGVPRIIYLGGLGELGDGLSTHLASRREVETALASTGVPLTVLRAAMIIGSGSASFEILRYLVERLPIMLTPRWVSTECQPIAVCDVLHYLVTCLETPETVGRTLDIGGPDVLDVSRN
jgi:uncharacterized protein YbjT (DUF2867 family)